MTAFEKCARVVLLTCAGGILLSADTLVLRNGATVTGTYLGGDARQIRMDQNGAVQTYDIAQVQSVIFAEHGYQPPAQQYSTGPNNYPPPAPQNYPPPATQSYPPQAQNYPSPAPPAAAGITIPADTEIKIRMIDSVNSDTAYLGQTFRASIDEPVYVNGQQVIPRGSDVMTKLVQDQQSGKIEGRTVLTLALSTVTLNGRAIDVTSTNVRTESGSRGARSAGVIGGATALGAIIGAVAGGGKGAAIGAGSGAVVGTGAEVLTSGQKVKIPSETRLTFKLQSPAYL